MSKIIVKQKPEAEVAVEVLADAIVAMSAGIKKLMSGPLNEYALVLLIQNAAPSVGGKWNKAPLTQRDVKAVLQGLQSLEATYIKKPTKT